MLCGDLIKILEKYAPIELAEGWDNPGIQVGDLRQEVKKIMTALDATDMVIEQAIHERVDMLITHHPLLFKPVKKITEEDFIGRRIRKLIRNNISLYAMHTNCDIAKMADYSAFMLDLADAEPLGEDVALSVELSRTEEFKNKNRMGIGKVGNLKEELTLEEFCEKIKRKFNIKYVRMSGDKETVIRRAAVCPGAGRDYIEDALAKGAQVLVTGDLGHHAVLDARARGLCLIDAGHFGTEVFMKEQLADALRGKEEIKLDGIQILVAEEEEPFKIL